MKSCSTTFKGEKLKCEAGSAVNRVPGEVGSHSSSLEDGALRDDWEGRASLFWASLWILPCCRDFQECVLSQSVDTVSLSQIVEVSVSLR